MSRNVDRLIEIMARLRDPVGGCPWDQEQDFKSIAPYTIEEAYEVADAIDRADLEALRAELGDLLLQVVYHARMAEEAGAFSFDDVAATICDKMVDRHPHVFGTAEVDSAARQTAAWEAHKAAERRSRAQGEGRPPGVLDDVPLGLPALSRADKLQQRAARVGFDWPQAIQVLDKIAEEMTELRAGISGTATAAQLEDEVGDLLFASANLARHLGIDPEAALRGCNAKFERRFAYIESALAAAGRSPDEASLDEMEALWRQAKRRERETGPD
ncbi:MAG: nucleoside triphosphate pyrophosphohydrolase [Kiloniellales bacterium]